MQSSLPPNPLPLHISNASQVARVCAVRADAPSAPPRGRASEWSGALQTWNEVVATGSDVEKGVRLAGDSV